MTWVRMLADSTKRVNRSVSKDFKAGGRYSVPKVWAEEFLAAGVAESIETPARGQVPASPRPRRRAPV